MQRGSSIASTCSSPDRQRCREERKLKYGETLLSATKRLTDWDLLAKVWAQAREEYRGLRTFVELADASGFPSGADVRHWESKLLCRVDASDYIAPIDKLSRWALERYAWLIGAFFASAAASLAAAILWREGLPLTVFCATMFGAAAFSRNILSALAPERTSVLFLRRFHKERAPAYPVSQVMNGLVQRGYDVVTLRDSIVESDKVTAFLPLLIALVLPAVVLALVPLLLVLALGVALTVWPIYELGILFDRSLSGRALGYESAPFLMSAAVVLGLWALVVWRKWRQLNDLDDLFLKWTFLVPWFFAHTVIMERLARSRNASEFLGEFAAISRLRGRGQLGMTVIAAEDSVWVPAVCRLMDYCRVVFVDLSDPTSNIELEVSELSKREGLCLPIWLRASGSPSCIRQFGGQYQVLSSYFTGEAIEIEYPGSASEELYSFFGYAEGARLDQDSPAVGALVASRTIESLLKREKRNSKAASA